MRDGSSDGSSACWRTDNKMKSLTVGLWQSASWRLFNPLWSEGTDLSTRQRRRRCLTSEPDTCYLHNKSSLCWYWKRASGTWGALTMTANTLCAGAAAIHGADVLINDAFEGLLAIPSCHLSLSLSLREKIELSSSFRPTCCPSKKRNVRLRFCPATSPSGRAPKNIPRNAGTRTRRESDNENISRIQLEITYERVHWSYHRLSAPPAASSWTISNDALNESAPSRVPTTPVCAGAAEFFPI